MAGKGKWTIQTKFKRCWGERKCAACEASDGAPHGPYYELRRRNPVTGKQEGVYLGKVLLTPEDLAEINESWDDVGAPTKWEVLWGRVV